MAPYPLHDAARNGDSDALLKLLASGMTDVGQKDNLQRQALHMAAWAGHAVSHMLCDIVHLLWASIQCLGNSWLLDQLYRPFQCCSADVTAVQSVLLLQYEAMQNDGSNCHLRNGLRNPCTFS